MRFRTNRKLTALICLGAYMLTVVAPGGWMVWCIGSDGHQALELPHQLGPADNGSGGGSFLDQLSNAAESPVSLLSRSRSDPDVARSSLVCIDTPVVSALLARGSGASLADQVAPRPIPAVLSHMRAAGVFPRLASWFRLADAPLDFTPPGMSRVVILQI
jgi:hypothetical protein